MLTEEEVCSAIEDSLESLDALFVHLLFSNKGKAKRSDVASSMQSLQIMLAELVENHPELQESITPIYLSATDIEALEELTVQDLKRIDATLESYVCEKWKKNVYIIGQAFLELSNEYSKLSDVWYAKRLKYLTKKNQYKLKGNIDCIGYCEIRK